MKNKFLKLTLLFLLTFGITFAQEETPQFEQELYGCLDLIQPFEIEKAIPCIKKANTECELEMKKTYDELMELVDDKKILINSQNKWEKYRDAQVELMKSFLNKKPNEWQVERRLIKFELTKNRLFELETLTRINNY